MENRKIDLTRNQLYDEVWKLSVAGVARKYELDYVCLIETCKKERIPFPPSGYWSKLKCGKDVSNLVVPLEGEFDAKVDYIIKTSKARKIKKVEKIDKVEKVESKPEQTLELLEKVAEKEQENSIAILNEVPIEDDDLLPFLNPDERKKVLQVANALKINDNQRIHSVLVKYRKLSAEYYGNKNKADNISYGRYGYNRYNQYNQIEPAFFKEVSNEGEKRILSILSAIFRAIENLGGAVNDDLTLKIRNEVVAIRVAESKSKIKHELTKQEAKELIEYQDALKTKSWASKPRIREYDNEYNGRLRIIFGERNFIGDTKNEKLEEQLGDILISLYEKSEEVRIERERREEEQRKREEEARRKEEARKKKKAEIIRTQELANEAEDYRIACEIRAYLKAKIEANEATPEWIDWASKKADWYDPVIAREDEYLGARAHGESAEAKDLEKLLERSWLW